MVSSIKKLLLHTLREITIGRTIFLMNHIALFIFSLFYYQQNLHLIANVNTTLLAPTIEVRVNAANPYD